MSATASLSTSVDDVVDSLEETKMNTGIEDAVTSVPALSSPMSSSSTSDSRRQLESMSILRALDELTLLDKRIMKKAAELQMMTTVSRKTRHIDPIQFTQAARSDWQSVQDLIIHRQRIKSAVVVSNANTYVTVGKERLSVAEVIERKKSLVLQKALLNRLRTTRTEVIRDTEKANAAVESDLQTLLLSGNGAGASNSKAGTNIETFSTHFRELNQAHILDPSNCDKLIKELEAYIDAFEREAKFTLGESNAITKISI